MTVQIVDSHIAVNAWNWQQPFPSWAIQYVKSAGPAMQHLLRGIKENIAYRVHFELSLVYGGCYTALKVS
jgi:hypothetical protein